MVRCLYPPSWVFQQYGPAFPWGSSREDLSPPPSRGRKSWTVDGGSHPRNHGNSWHSGYTEGDVHSGESESDEEGRTRGEPGTHSYQYLSGVRQICDGLWLKARDIYNDSTGASEDSDDELSALNSVPWIPPLHLTLKDKVELQRSTMLSDKHISAGQVLLQFQFPSMRGLQDTCLSQTEFAREDRGQPVVQIHHVRSNHWVTSARRHGDTAIDVMDSLYDSVTPDLVRQLRQVYGRLEGDDGDDSVDCVEVPHSRYRLTPVQTQTGFSDCGIFAIAFALEVCLERQTTHLRFRQSEMRTHLLNCFEEGFLSPFPKER